ncbi:hypothetical protein MAC_04916 [Metarhizium acridum CQMa 102]|uniref:Uncharacterized protein n=1 Tax=Metarhizium acridum (strain CQMa 102) TaxID=655827 RepID=E9E4W8_METAQ|nr:uncharacterized protein MAC_04916 [Metarhizium acridum CQMa 102]EFY88985.1 hypothetical protein MAC_04916 [Metarhizium acridum CQMa 102]
MCSQNRKKGMDAYRRAAKGSAPRDLSSVLAPKKAGNPVDNQDADLPPPYTELPELSVLPSYLSACPLKPYRPFPHTIRAHHRLSQLNSITLGGPDKDRLYYVEVHKGFQHVDPLGYRAGVVLRNGPRSKDEVLAAAGEEMQSALRIYAVPLGPDPNSVFFLPPMEFGTNSRAMTMERMRPGVLRNRTRAFTFFVEVEPLRSMRRQKFEWVQDTNGECVKMPGFRLVRVVATEGKGSSESDASTSAPRSADDVYGETIATLTFPHASLVSREAFTLCMLGSAKDGRLGERCEIAIVVTALRIWNFHAKGQLDKPQL